MVAEKSEVVKTTGADVWLEDDIVWVRYTKDKISLNDMKENIKAADEFARATGIPVPVLIDMGGETTTVERAARKVVVQSIDPELYCKGALVFHNPVQRAVASFFLGLSRAKAETKAFSSVEEAKRWLKE